MSRHTGKKIRQNREEGKKLLAVAAAVILIACVITGTLAARVYLTVLSDETAQLNEHLEELTAEFRHASAGRAGEDSPYALAEKAAEQGMTSSGEGQNIFIPGPKEDMIRYYPTYETKKDKPIWEYFG